MKERFFILLCIIIFSIISIMIFKEEKIIIQEEFKPNFTFPFYKEERKEEYLDYKNKTGLPIKDAIIRVNIGLKKPFYENTSLALDIDKITMLVNKYHYVNKDYLPKYLIDINGLLIHKKAYEAYKKMKEDMSKENLDIEIISAYRSYDYQSNLYNNYLKYESKSLVDSYSARPGYSEHHTGLAIDVDNKKVNYEKFHLTKEFLWMTSNAHKYGFILRYPEDKENITGYMYEPWHYRYVGIDIATYIKNHNITYEEYFYEFIDK